MSVVKEKEWIMPIEAAALLQISRGHLIKTAPSMGIRMRQIPGSRWRWYRREDVLAAKARLDAQAERSIQVATEPSRRRKAARTATA